MRERFAVPPEFRRGFVQTDDHSKRSAWESLEHIRTRLGLESFGNVDILDVGCGSKFTQCFLNNDLPVRRYVGIDVSSELIGFLRQHVDDPRFEYHHLDSHNARYNPDGVPLSEHTRLPLEDGSQFHLICLLSVFTHLNPADYRAMLQLLRRYVKGDGRLFYSVFIDEKTETGKGMMDRWAEVFGDSAVGTTERFQDFDQSDVLAYALYSRDYALELVEGTGWEVLSLEPPTEHIQHQVICRPI